MEDIVWKCYDEGFAAWDEYAESDWAEKPSNPYKPKTLEWRSWNRGWSTNENGLTAPATDTGKQ